MSLIGPGLDARHVPKKPALVEMPKIVVSVRCAMSIASLKVGTAERVVAVGNDHDHAAAGHISQLFVRKLPDRVVKRRLRTGLLDLVDGLVEKVESCR